MNETLTRTADVVSVGAVASVAPDVENLLDFLPVLYVGGSSWFATMSGEVEFGCADAFSAVLDNVTIGVGFGVLKPSNRYKVRTLFVSPSYRGHGIGSALLRALVARAIEVDADEMFVTAASIIRDEFQPLVSKAGFNFIATEVDRYGTGRDEDIYVKRLI